MCISPEKGERIMEMKKENKKLPTVFSKCMNQILGAPDNRTTKEANIHFELNELIRKANAIGALFQVIRLGKNACFTLDYDLIIWPLAQTGERLASDIHSNVNSLQGLLNISIR
jgi:hypothetical protein